MKSLISGVRIAKTSTSLSKSKAVYRTNSHAGLPKGSYAIPNPMHYHIVRYGEIAARLRPVLVKIGHHNRPKSYMCNKLTQVKHNPTVTINIGNNKCVTLDIPIATMKEFIYPFANAMNLINIQESCSTGSQTSFISPVNISAEKESSFVNITELCVKNNTLVPKQFPDQSEYESKILKDLRDNLLDESVNQESETESNQTDSENMFNSNLDIKALAKDVIEQAKFIEKDLTSLEDVIHDAILISKDLPMYSEGVMGSESVESWASCASIKTDSTSSEIHDDIVLNYEDCNKTILNEGVNFTTLYTSNCQLENTDEKVVLMSDAIYDYLVKQCFESLELSPEILHEYNISRLFTILDSHYSVYSGNNLSNEDENLLRLNIANRVIHKFEIYDESLNDCTNSQYVSNKIFTISELVSAILDSFFTKCVNGKKDPCNSREFSKFTQEVEENKLVQQSTPQCVSHQIAETSYSFCMEDDNQNDEDEIVISFKAKETKNLRNEKYWIAITKSPDIGKTPTRKHEIINVDDIPLKPPPDFNYWNDLASISEAKLPPVIKHISTSTSEAKPLPDLYNLNNVTATSVTTLLPDLDHCKNSTDISEVELPSDHNCCSKSITSPGLKPLCNNSMPEAKLPPVIKHWNISASTSEAKPSSDFYNLNNTSETTLLPDLNQCKNSTDTSEVELQSDHNSCSKSVTNLGVEPLCNLTCEVKTLTDPLNNSTDTSGTKLFPDLNNSNDGTDTSEARSLSDLKHWNNAPATSGRKLLSDLNHWSNPTVTSEVELSSDLDCYTNCITNSEIKSPHDFNYWNNFTAYSGALSPIPEEVACNLFAKFGLSDEEASEENNNLNNTFKVEEENVQLNNLLNNHYNTESTTYISFDCPETNAVVCNSVSFYRTNTVNTFSYTQPAGVTFLRQNVPHSTLQREDQRSLETVTDNHSSDEGDWMGYEAAKF